MTGNDPNRILAVALLAFLVLALALPPVRGEENADFNGITLAASPKVQGIGGVVVLTVSANFYGGCCYALHAFDVVPNITYPAGLERLTGPAPARIDKFEATQGGLLTTAYFTYSFKTLKEGEYPVNVTVSTRNCGAKSASMRMEYIKGAIISEPELIYPAIMSRNTKSVISVVIFSGLEGVTVGSADMRYAPLDPGANPGSLKADDSGMLQPGNVRGGQVPLSRDAENTKLWRGNIPPAGRKGQMAVWFVALDSTGNTTVSGVTVYRVADVGGVYSAVLAEPFIIIGLMALGLAVIALYDKRTAGVLVALRGPSLDIPGTTRPFESEDERPRRIRAVLAACSVCTVVALLVTFWAFSDGLFELMRSFTGGL